MMSVHFGPWMTRGRVQAKGLGPRDNGRQTAKQSSA